MADLDDLLSDLESINYHNYQPNKSVSSKSSESSSSIGSADRNQQVNFRKQTSPNFIDSINRIIEPRSVRRHSGNYPDYENVHGDNSSSGSEKADLTDLDNLLEDLYIARKELQVDGSRSNSSGVRKSLKSSLSSQENDSNVSVSVSLSPSCSSASPNSESQKSPNQSSLSNDMPNGAVNKLKASRELESLMASLSMYKAPSIDSNACPISEKTNSPVSRINNQSVNVLKNVCRACDGPINGQVITALGSLWHPEHFKCSYCNCSIGTSIFYEKDNEPYCEHDYLQLFSPKCAACSLPILDKMLTALNKSWHLKCFRCKSCSKPLNDESFLEINSSSYCKDCYVNELAPKCKRCSEAIVDNFISALDAYFHPGCFVCVECGLPFNATSFYEFQNMPYCEIHYHLKRGSLCNSCSMPINGRCITAMNKKYHPEHFKCSFCLQQLNKGTFKTCPNEKPYCHSCFHKLFPI